MRILASTVSTLPNKLLSALPQAEWDVLLHDLRPTHMARGQTLLAHGEDPQHAFFVEDGIVSVVASAGHKASGAARGVQVAMVGNDGLVGGLALLGSTPAPMRAVVQFPGSALSIPVATLATRMEEMPGLRRTCMGHLQAFVAQVVDTAASNARDTVPRRCARWLLMADDRAGGSNLPVTHETLASLLGVRRAGVTLAMATLHGEGLIQTRRGCVVLLDRQGLRAFSATRLAPSVAHAA